MSSQIKRYYRGIVNLFSENMTFALSLVFLFSLNFILFRLGLIKYIDLLAYIWVVSVFVLSYDLLLGYVGLLNFGHVVFFGFGAYVTTYILLWTSLPYPIAMVISMLVGLCLGFLLSFVFRNIFHGIPFTFVSLAIAMIVFFLYRKRELLPISGAEAGLTVPIPHAVKSFEWTLFFVAVFLVLVVLVGLSVLEKFRQHSSKKKRLGILILFLALVAFSLFFVMDGLWAFMFVEDFRRITPNFYLLSIIVLCACYLFSRRLAVSPVGHTWLAIRENELRARVIGFDVFKYKSLALIIAGGMAALAGSIYAPFRFVVSPETVFTPLISIYATVYAIIGGIGTLNGAIIGTIVGILLERLLIDYLGPWGVVVLGAIFIGFVLRLPYGIVGSLKMWELKRKVGRST